MKIKDLCTGERPREKLLSMGARHLSNAELLAVLLRSGTGSKNVLEVAQELLKYVEGDLDGLYAMSRDVFLRFNGIGETKAATVMAALELGRRSLYDGGRAEKVLVTGPETVYRMMLPLLKGLDHEECWVLYINRGNYVITKELISSGGLSSTAMDSRYIARKVIEKQASAIILVHNHPSGNPYPGESDMTRTSDLRKVLKTFDISLMDHVVIAGSRYFSFADSRAYGADNTP